MTLFMKLNKFTSIPSRKLIGSKTLLCLRAINHLALVPIILEKRKAWEAMELERLSLEGLLLLNSSKIMEFLDLVHTLRKERKGRNSQFPDLRSPNQTNLRKTNPLAKL